MITYDGLPGIFRSTIGLPEASDAVDIDDVSLALSRVQDSIRFLGNERDRMLDLLTHYAQGTGSPTTTLAALGGTLADVTGIACSCAPRVGDRMIVEAVVCCTATGSGQQGQLRIRYSSASVSATVAGSASVLFDVTTNSQVVVVRGIVVAAFAELTTFQLQGAYIGSAGIDVTNSWSINVLSQGGGA